MLTMTKYRTLQALNSEFELDGQRHKGFQVMLGLMRKLDIRLRKARWLYTQHPNKGKPTHYQIYGAFGNGPGDC